MSEFEMTIDAVREIATRTMGTLTQQADSSTRVFGDVELPPSAFGGWPAAAGLGRHHQAAHEVFRRTLEGVVADLEEFAQNLRDTADSSERRDEEVQAALVALGKGYRHRSFKSQESYSATVEALTGVAGVDAATLADGAGDAGVELAEAPAPETSAAEAVMSETTAASAAAHASSDATAPSDAGASGPSFE